MVTGHVVMDSYPTIRTAVWDIETDGLLDKLTRVHILVIRDYERRITHVFRQNDRENTIEQGLAMLEQAEILVGHNLVSFDLPALDICYDDVNITGRIFDTLVMARMVFSDQKEKDFRLFERKKLPGKMIGAHSLKAWGYRLGLHKGDYQENMEKQAEEEGLEEDEDIAAYVWKEWSQEMEDYAVQDVEVTTLLYEKLLAKKTDPRAIQLEHQIHELMSVQERNGIHFNVEEADELAHKLQEESDLLRGNAIGHFGNWWVPEKKKIIASLWDDPDGINKAKVYAKPDQIGEDGSRKVWGEVTFPKKARTMTKGESGPVSYAPDAPYCKVKLKEFNPGSRPQVIDRLSTVHGWHPVDFTEKGAPEVSDSVLRKLTHVPMALELAELFYYNKRLGQLVTGKNALLRKVVDGKIHAYVNVGGTVSGRASHVSPNLAQVPKVKHKKRTNEDGSSTSYIAKGRDGDHGFEFRKLFVVPDDWTLTGIDLSGIELRCFGEKLAKYDKGAYIDIVLSGDIHSFNQRVAELSSRDQAKTMIYAMLYGAGDIKIGSIVEPLAPEEEQRVAGKKLRERFMKNLPAYAQVVRDVKIWARSGYLPGLDGRKLFVRSPHSALNTLLQSDAALIAKKWVLMTRDSLEDMGWMQGWDGDFANLLWIHDEQQIASRGRDRANIVEATALTAAINAGKFFGYSCPIEAAGKSGSNWAETH